MSKVYLRKYGVYISVFLVLLLIVFVSRFQVGEEDHSWIVELDKKSNATSTNEMPEYDYKEAINHIGEMAIVNGTVASVFTSKKGVTFLDFCSTRTKCPFSVVIFASDREKFPDVSKYVRQIKIKGIIKSYKGSAEIILTDPDQIQ